MTEQLANLAISTLASGMDASQTTLTVATGEGAKFPSSGNFRVTVEDEIMLCTSRSGDVLTITRAQESTSAATHAISLPVAHTLTKAGLDQYLTEKNYQPKNSYLTDIASTVGHDEGFGLVFNGSDLVEWLPVQSVTSNVGSANTDLAWSTNWTPYGMVFTYLVTTGGGTLRSLGAPGGTSAYQGDGTRIVIRNETSSSITIKHALAGGSGYQFKMRDSADLTLAQNESAEFVYRSSTTEWKELDRNRSISTEGTGVFQPLNSKLTSIAGLGGDEGFGLIFNSSAQLVEWLPVQLIATTITGTPTDKTWSPDWNYCMVQAFIVTSGGGTLRSVGRPNGFTAYSGDGVRLVVQNIASSSITIAHNGATPTYKPFKTRDSADLVLAQNESAEFIYRFATDDWREIDRNVSLSAVYQPLDATLTALAGANWATDSLAIGTGTDTVSQVTFAANTFPAKASTGSLVAKTITDFGLSLVDDADMATARTTLGLDWVTDTVSISTSDVRLSWIWGDTPLVIMSNSGSGVLNAIGVPNNGAGTRVVLITTNTIQLNHNNAGAEAELFIPTQATSYMDSGTIAEFMYDGTYWRYLAPVAGTVYVEDGAGNFAGSHNLENILASIYTEFLATVFDQFTELFALS